MEQFDFEAKPIAIDGFAKIAWGLSALPDGYISFSIFGPLQQRKFTL